MVGQRCWCGEREGEGGAERGGARPGEAWARPSPRLPSSRRSLALELASSLAASPNNGPPRSPPRTPSTQPAHHGRRQARPPEAPAPVSPALPSPPLLLLLLPRRLVTSTRQPLTRPPCTHSERAQPTHRKKLGLLEKHADYVKRARDFHSKEDRIQKLREKAAMRNKDEFYFGMINSKTKVRRRPALRLPSRPPSVADPPPSRVRRRASTSSRAATSPSRPISSRSSRPRTRPTSACRPRWSRVCVPSRSLALAPGASSLTSHRLDPHSASTASRSSSRRSSTSPCRPTRRPRASRPPREQTLTRTGTCTATTSPSRRRRSRATTSSSPTTSTPVRPLAVPLHAP